MKAKNPNVKFDNLNAGYNGIIDYHNALVQIRFTVAGLSIAADGFLASALFTTSAPLFSKIIISVLGIILTFICGMLEIRTFHLLMSLLEGGYGLEKAFGFKEDQGMFSILMQNQLVPRYLSRPPKGSAKRQKFIFSHSVMFGLLYVCILIFWLTMLGFVLLKIV